MEDFSYPPRSLPLGGTISAYAEQKAWVKYADGTLTFQYGEKSELDTDEYWLPDEGKIGDWVEAKRTSVNKVVFDESFAYARPTTCSYWFSDFTFLTTIEGFENLNTSEVKDMDGMFYHCYGLTSLDLFHFDTSKVTEMDFMFYGCSKIKSLNVSTFNTSNVKYMQNMFQGCTELTTIIASDKFVTTQVTKSNDMFSGCEKLVGDIEYDENKVDKTYATFNGGYFLDSKYVHPWAKYDSSNSTLTFQYGYKTTLEPINEFWLNEDDQTPDWNKFDSDITKVVFDESFAHAYPTTCHMWFSGFLRLATIDGIENLNTSKVTNMSSMFYGCKALTSLDLSHFNTSKVTDMQYMFYDCTGLTSLDLSNFNTSKVTNMRYMFYGCSGLISLNLSKFNTSNVTNMSYMFQGCSGLISLDLSRFDTSNVTNMANMFYNCSGLISLDLSKFNTSEVTLIRNMFYNCTGLTSLDISNFDTSKVTDMQSAFQGCYRLTSLDLPNFDISNANDMYNMFRDCSALNAIYFSDKFDVDKLSGIRTENMLYHCPATLYCSPLHYEGFKSNSVIVSLGHTVKPYVGINAKSEYGTLCVPVGSSLEEGSFTGFDKLYTVTKADKNNGTITLAEATSLEPGVPYVYHRYLEGDNNKSVITFDVDENASAAVAAPKNDNSFLKGTFRSIVAPAGKYILQTDGMFHPVAQGNTTLSVGAYRAYLDLNSTEIGGFDEGPGAAKSYKMIFEDNQTTAINGISDKIDNLPKTYFDLMGRRVSTPKCGGLYIVNSKKVIYKN